ncbi:PadR family transcriptional regulator [Agromyces larvae]|uniref:PadR family transcriptional regulator n=1 Tax=Agromyces larvae TaxID=2929802 RepID=A0ABY4BUB4_9MICO|nr:PadR family transcriptional regulator [Agromyces larvae]UOE42735.1 PadR family transcriptional regulator [Agromyces larvae]
MPRRRPGVLLPLELDILEAGVRLQAAGGAFHGFGLARELADGDGSALTAHGTLYKALSRMADAGLLESEWEPVERAAAEGRPRRRLYRVTAEGARVARAQRAGAAAAAAPRLGLA